MNLTNTNASLIYGEYCSEIESVNKYIHIHTHIYTEHLCGSDQHNESIFKVLNFTDEQHSLSWLQFSEVQATNLQQALMESNLYSTVLT